VVALLLLRHPQVNRARRLAGTAIVIAVTAEAGAAVIAAADVANVVIAAIAAGVAVPGRREPAAKVVEIAVATATALAMASARNARLRGTVIAMPDIGRKADNLAGPCRIPNRLLASNLPHLQPMVRTLRRRTWVRHATTDREGMGRDRTGKSVRVGAGVGVVAAADHSAAKWLAPKTRAVRRPARSARVSACSPVPVPPTVSLLRSNAMSLLHRRRQCITMRPRCRIWHLREPRDVRR